jgi:SAM-dependent methyltransferase
MYTNPYNGIYPAVEGILRELIPPEDTYHAKHTRRLARTLHILLDQQPKGRLLEIGTGCVIPLALQHLLPELEVVVTNLNPMEDLEHTVWAEIGRHAGQFEVYNVDLEYGPIPEPDGTFDWILCCEVLEHMEIDPMFMLAEINRLLPEGGGLLLTTPNVVSARGLTKMMQGVEPYFYMQYNKDRSYHRHNYEYSAKSLGFTLRAAGFGGTVWAEDTFEDPITGVVDQLRAAGFTVDNVGDNLFAISRKSGPIVNRYPGFLYAPDE